MSQEQQQQEVLQAAPEQQEERAETEPALATESAESPGVVRKKRRKKKTEPVSEQELSPRPSLWPLLLAASLALLLAGVVIHPVVLGLGVLFVVCAIIGWTLERR